MSEMNSWKRQPNETEDAYLWRLGTLKESGLINFTWPQLAIILNSATGKSLAESTWRKRFNQIMLDNAASQSGAVNEKTAEIKVETVDEEEEEAKEDESVVEEDLDAFDADKMIIRLRDERYAINRMVRSVARGDAVLDLFRSEIHKYDKKDPPKKKTNEAIGEETAIYALLSDIHYGAFFRSSAGDYDSDIARERVMNYAEKIIEIGLRNGANECYVSLLGDLISGIIHNPIRIENRENAVEQVIGVSELIADFLYRLSDVFEFVYVNSVSGNHSRLDQVAETSLRAEKLDALIPWYCKAKLENVSNVFFVDNSVDPTVCAFNICGKNFVGVHGDMDKDLARSAMRFERLCGYPVDYMVAGHLHVPNLLMEDRGYIRNGSVCGSGDDYTMRNRLFANPSQVCMTVTSRGVQSVWPIAV